MFFHIYINVFFFLVVTYEVVTTRSECSRVTSLADCETAARELGLSDTTASDDGQDGVTFDPPYCYFESSRLKFNSLGTNTGACTPYDQCICATSTTGQRGMHWSELNQIMFFGSKSFSHTIQLWIALGAVGDHGDPVQRHVVQAQELVQDQGMDHLTGVVNA